MRGDRDKIQQLVMNLVSNAMTQISNRDACYLYATKPGNFNFLIQVDTVKKTVLAGGGLPQKDPDAGYCSVTKTFDNGLETKPITIPIDYDPATARPSFEEINLRKRPVRARTIAQDAYIRALRRHALVFAAGPVTVTGPVWPVTTMVSLPAPASTKSWPAPASIESLPVSPQTTSSPAPAYTVSSPAPALIIRSCAVALAFTMALSKDTALLVAFKTEA